MASFEDNLARMKALYTYGRELNENKAPLNYAIEHTAVAADGNTYGIIRECKKYYIKKARKGQENIAESYDYLGGFCNRKLYEYDSYGNALKNFELKMGSLNEAYDGTVETSTLDPFRKEEFLAEATEEFRNEIARQRQIMHNVAVLMNESTEIGADRKKDGTVMYDGTNPEAETGKKGDEGCKTVSAEPEYKGSDTKGPEKKAEPFSCNAPVCKDQLKEESECSGETCAECGNLKSECTCGKQGECNEENSAGTGSPDNIGWDMKGDKQVSEASEVECGISETDGEDSEPESDDDVDEFELDDIDWDDIDLDDIELDDLDFGDETEPEGAEDIEDGEDAEDTPDEERPEDMSEPGDDEGDTEDEFDIDLSADDDEDDEPDESADDDSDEGADDSVPSEEELDAELDSEDDDDEEQVPAHDGHDFASDGEDDGTERRMDDIINEVVDSIIAEERLNVFGKHPGYRKKPMELPSTGDDKNQWGEDINDDSVHNEEPFGEKIGDGDPFSKMVSDIASTVIGKLNESFLSSDKKKVK